MREVWLGKNSAKRRYRIVSTARSQAFAWRTVVELVADDGSKWRYIGHVGRPIPWNARLSEVTS